MYNKEQFKDRILSGVTGESFIANRIHSLLNSTPKFRWKEIKDFLEDKQLFDDAKKEIYDILTKEHQRYFDIAERILRWNKQTQKEKEYAEACEMAHTRDLFVGLKKWSKGRSIIMDTDDIKFCLHWGLAETIIINELRSEIQQKTDKEPSDGALRTLMEETFSDEALRAYDPLTLSTLIINTLKRYTKALGLPFLPEYVKYHKDDKEPHQDRLNTNMNTTSVIMGIPFTKEWWRKFSEPSIEFMMRLKSEFFNIFMCHFDIDTPEKMNQVMETFKTYPKICEKNGANLEWDDSRNMFVEFVLDSFARPEIFSYYLKYFHINDLRELEKLFPYGMIGGKMNRWNRTLSLEKTQEVFDFFNITSIDQYIELLESMKQVPSQYENKYDKIELFQNHEIWSLQSICDFLWLESPTDKFNALKNDIFSLVIADEETFKKLCSILELATKEDRLHFVKEERNDAYTLINDFKVYGNIFEEYDLLFDATLSRKENLMQIFHILKYKGISTGKNLMEIEKVDENNWTQLTLDYANAHHDVNHRIEEKEKEKLNQLFQPVEAKDLVYANIKDIYLRILHQQTDQLSYQQLATIKILQHCGVGNMSAITLLVNLTKETRELTKNDHKEQIVAEKILQNLKSLEEKMKNRFVMEQANLYGNITTLLQISPKLANVSCELLHTFSNKGLKDFSKDILPLIISWVLLLEKDIGANPGRWDHEPVYGYDPNDLIEIQYYIANIPTEKKSISAMKWEILSRMSERIQKQFGLKTLLIDKLEENLITVQHFMIYMANIHVRNARDTKLLWLFFWLQMNDKRHDFRAGKEIDFSTIFEENTLNELRKYLHDKKAYPLFKQYDEATQYQLQAETVSQRLGNVVTIDTELSAIQQDIQDLWDPDNFPEQMALFNLLLTHGKEIGAVLSAIFQKKDLSAQWPEIQRILETKFWPLNPVIIPTIQAEIKKINPVITFVKNIEEMDIPACLAQLQTIKTPTTEMIQIFGKVGERLSTDSGILPLVNDINYVKAIFTNNGHNLNIDEREKALNYIANVEAQVQLLYEIKARIRTLFVALQQQLFGSNNHHITERMKIISQKIQSNTTDEKISLTTKMTNNFDVIIPNIRGCLWCMQKECNNHHNLTFGDANKFFMAVYGASEDKTIADGLVSIFPYQTQTSKNTEEVTEHTEEQKQTEQRLAFIIERIYGERTPDVLLSIIQTIRKKQEETGVSDIDIFVSNDALTSCYTNLHHVQEEFKDETLIIENASLNIEKTQSPSGYGYYEFGDDGILIKRNT